MIYSPNNNKPLVLVEAAADEFLEAVGVELYEDEISINGTLYEGSYGESILVENGIFLYEDGIVVEANDKLDYKYHRTLTPAMINAHGKQAFAYRHAKKRAALDAEEKDFNRYIRRYSDHTPGTNTKSGKKADNDRRFGIRRNRYFSELEARRKKYFNAENRLDALERSGHDKNSALYKKSKKVFDKADERLGNFGDNSHVIFDTIDRHERRHTKKSTVQHNSTIFSDINFI